MSGLDKRLSRLEESLSRPVYDVRKPILGGASKKSDTIPVNDTVKKINIDMSKYNQILQESWVKLSAHDYIRYAKFSSPGDLKGGTIRSIIVNDGQNEFVLSSYNRTWHVPFKEIKVVYRLNKETKEHVQNEKKVSENSNLALENFKEISRETSSAKYDEVTMEMANLRREVVQLRETLDKVTTWINKQIDMNSQNKT